MGNTTSCSTFADMSPFLEDMDVQAFVEETKTCETLGVASKTMPEIMEATNNWNIADKLQNCCEWMQSLEATDRKEMRNGLVELRHSFEAMRKGLVHNSVSGLPNERALLEWWNSSKPVKCTMILFEIRELDRIRERIGFEEVESCVTHAVELLQENIAWFEHESGKDVSIYHPDFNATQLLVVTGATDADDVRHFCQCFMGDARKFLKVFPHGARVAAGFAVVNGVRKPIDAELKTWFCRCYEALGQAWNGYQRHEESDACIERWLSFEERENLGRDLTKNIVVLDCLRKNGSRVRSALAADVRKRIETLEREVVYGLNYGSLDAEVEEGNSVLQYLIATRDWHVVDKVLGSRQVDVDHQNHAGLTAPMVAMKFGAPQSVILAMLPHLRCPNLRDEKDRSLLWYCLRKEYWKVLESLRETGNFVDERHSAVAHLREDNCMAFLQSWRNLQLGWNQQIDPQMRTVAHYAAMHNASKCMHYILTRTGFGSMLNIAKDDKGNTPVAVAVHYSNVQVLEVLLSNGADVTLLNAANETCADMARKDGEVLLERRLVAFERRKSRPRFRRGSAVSVSSSESSLKRRSDSQNQRHSSSASAGGSATAVLSPKKVQMTMLDAISQVRIEFASHQLVPLLSASDKENMSPTVSTTETMDDDLLVQSTSGEDTSSAWSVPSSLGTGGDKRRVLQSFRG